ncbi:hypothetical protein LCGC14_1416100 [marine sediment metagenome]|uniref:Uncharacterized protein n=1 Tax=marine sediment metagenome TaxID=412755 RepID=A0A0F9M8A8_9ZZZZ
MTTGNNDQELEGVPAIGAIEGVESFLDKNLRRAFLSDVPTALTGGIIPNATSFPASPTLYQLFFRTDLAKLYFWNGANWLQLGLLESNSDLIIGGRYRKG